MVKPSVNGTVSESTALRGRPLQNSIGSFVFWICEQHVSKSLFL